MKWRIVIAVMAVSASLQAAFLWVQDSGPIIDAQETIQTQVKFYLPDTLNITRFQFDVVLSTPVGDYFEVLPANDFNILPNDLDIEKLDSVRTRVIWEPVNGDTLRNYFEMDYSRYPFGLVTLTGGYSPNAEAAIDTIHLENIIFSDAESKPVNISAHYGLIFKSGTPYIVSYPAPVPTKGQSFLELSIIQNEGVSAFQFDLVNPDHYPVTIDGIYSRDAVSWNIFDDTLRIINELTDDQFNWMNIIFTDPTAQNIPDPYPLIFTNLTAGDSLGNKIDMAYLHNAMIQGLSNNYGAVDDRSTPAKFILHPNFPNPFNPVTTISFSNPIAQRISVSIYNIIGQQVTLLADQDFQPGQYYFRWNATTSNGTSLSSGIYFTIIETSSAVYQQKIIYLK